MSQQKSVFQGISARAKRLIAGDENQELDFKRSAKGITSDDLVAFANSSTGGTILLGIDEVEDDQGRQKGKVVGCEVSDAMKLLINNRAFSCFPPIDVEIIVENNGKTPFYRIEIPTGKYKPYCTSGGNYKIREDGRNKVLQPDELLDIFLQSDTRNFEDRLKKINGFKEKKINLEHKINLLQKDMTLLHQKLNALLDKLDVEEI